MVKSLPANTGDMGSIPGPERFHMLGETRLGIERGGFWKVISSLGNSGAPKLGYRDYWGHALEPAHHGKTSCHNEKPPHCNPQPLLVAATKTQSSQK